MAETDTLLDLMDSFPTAFKDEQSDPSLDLESSTQSVSTGGQATNLGGTEALDPNLRQLMAEFPSAFVDPAAAELASKAGSSESGQTVDDQPSGRQTVKDSGVTALVNTEPASIPFQLAAQPGQYSQALKRQISTMTWGQVEFFLTYGDEGLQSIWVTVGKSGTEVQSLCEAIARLINLLLAEQVDIPEIARQIRGIRGADSEGLGPNRFLGLADLIGKVLQEAPPVLAPTPSENAPTTETSNTKNHTNGNHNGNLSTDLLHSSAWTELTDPDQAASICPECGAELHQVNGCSGGACVVCGYSSCS